MKEVDIIEALEEGLIGYFQRGGVEETKAHVMSHQLVKRARQVAVERQISIEAALEHLMKRIVGDVDGAES